MKVRAAAVRVCPSALGCKGPPDRRYSVRVDLETDRGVTLLRQLEDADMKCPVAQRLGDSCVYCPIEDHVIEGRKSPESVEGFCAGDYTACPTWQFEKERLAANKKANSYLVEARKEAAVTRDRAAEKRQDRNERAHHLLTGDSEEAVAFRRRVGIELRRRGQRVEVVRPG